MAELNELPRRSMEIQTKPWKYIGYRVFSQWLSSDSDFFLIRRFDTLNARVILMLQWEISVLEAKLARIDQERSAFDFPDVNNGSFEDDNSDRNALIQEIYIKLRRYSEHSWSRGLVVETNA
jgi:hypothetical protein